MSDENSILRLVCRPGDAVVALAVAYMDESVSDEKEPGVLTLAGYLFTLENASEAEARARAHLEGVGLDFYHQVDCAHGAKQYASMTPKERDSCQRELISNIHAHAEFGFCCNINLAHFREVIGDSAYQAYGVAAISCLNTIKYWTHESGFDGRISYLIEDGYKEKADAQRALLKMAELAPDYHRFRSLTFASKKDEPLLGAADMLAWFTAQEFTKRKRGEKFKRRKDFEALLRPVDLRADYNWRKLSAIKANLVNLYHL